MGIEYCDKTFNNPITESYRRPTQWIRIQLVFNTKYCDMVAFKYRENNKFLSTIMETIYLWAPCNNNGIVEIFTNKNFNDT